MACFANHGLIMRCDNHGCAEFIEFLKEMHDAGGNPVIDVASWLISIEYLRSGDYSSSNSDALLLPA